MTGSKGVGVAVGFGVAVGVGMGVGLGFGVGVSLGSGVGVVITTGISVTAGVGTAMEVGVGLLTGFTSTDWLFFFEPQDVNIKTVSTAIVKIAVTITIVFFIVSVS